MYMQPHNHHLGSDLARQKQRDMIAQAQRTSPARRVSGGTRVSRGAASAKQWLLRYFKHRPATPAPSPVPATTRMTSAFSDTGALADEAIMSAVSPGEPAIHHGSA